jgi:hypothetical protein
MNDLRERVRDLLVAARYQADGVAAAFLRLSRPVRIAALCAGVAVLVVAAAGILWLVGAPTDADDLARERAEQLHAELDGDFETTLRSLPSWATLTLADDGPGVMSGTVTVAGPDVCVGMAVRLDDEWLLDGDDGHVTLGEVRELDAAVCR